MTYLLMMMTSWAIVVDVWYLPPMEMRPGENSVEFAERVKHEIAKKGGLVELLWDGNLKRSKVGFLGEPVKKKLVWNVPHFFFTGSLIYNAKTI